MELLEEKILKDGLIKSGNVLKVDSFLNHQIDVPFIAELGKEFKRQFADRPINKILTIEASGIGIASVAAMFFEVPVLFAKKSSGSNMDNTLSRLWWATYLTVDEESDDKYRYTRVLLQDGNSDLLQNLSKSKLFRHKEAVIGILKFFSEYENRNDFSNVNRYIIQRFNRIGGVRQLVYMDRDYFYNESKIALEQYWKNK